MVIKISYVNKGNIYIYIYINLIVGVENKEGERKERLTMSKVVLYNIFNE